MYIKDLNWMRMGNLTMTVMWDSLDRISHLTGATRLEVERQFWKTLSSLETMYDVEVYLTGQVFLREGAALKPEDLDRDFWETFVQDLFGLTQQFLEA